MGCWKSTYVKCPICGKELNVVMNLDVRTLGGMYVSPDDCETCGRVFRGNHVIINYKDKKFSTLFFNAYGDTYLNVFKRWNKLEEKE
jgi:uncharacterized Zn finger protein